MKNDYGINNLAQIMPGVDLDKFQLRSWDRKLHEKLVVGYIGRQYSSSNRKNPNLLKKTKQKNILLFFYTFPLFYLPIASNNKYAKITLFNLR